MTAATGAPILGPDTLIAQHLDLTAPRASDREVRSGAPAPDKSVPCDASPHLFAPVPLYRSSSKEMFR
jgi:hypothetical protein